MKEDFPKEFKEIVEDETDEEVFRRYVENLDLSPEDFEGKTLDVGADAAQFEKWAREHNVSQNIYSLEASPKEQKGTRIVKGLVEELPFRDEEFDLVISHFAIPNVITR